MNTIGRIFKISIFGESHGKAVGVVVDGCPAGILLSENDFEADLSRRRSGSKGTTPRKELDLPEIYSGLFNGKTTGRPIAILFKNNNTISSDYNEFRDVPRPGHADFVAQKKWNGFNDNRGGGHFSGRITIGLVAAGVIAKKIINPIDIQAKLIEVGGNKDIEKAIDEAIKNNDSIGGLIECKAINLPIGLGEPFFDSVEALISHMIFSIPAIKGIEFGSGFEAAKMKGSQHNDPFISSDGKTTTNHASGINGGITNGNDIVFRIAVKPTSSISKTQNTFNLQTGKMVDMEVKGRHDVCIALRMPVIAEAATAIALADLKLCGENAFIE